MRLYFLAAIAAIDMFLAGCSSIPDQFELTQVDTLDIIRRVRCETKEAVLDYQSSHWINRVRIAYGFDFQSVENNNISAEATFLFPIHLGSFTLPLNAGSDRSRDIDNKIDLTENLGNLREIACSNAEWTQSFRYPIIGRLGTAEIIHRYAELSTFSGVSPDTLVRTLRFAVKINGGANPSISIVPALRHQIDAELNLTADRQDVHQLILTLTPPAPEVEAPPGAARALVERAGRRADEITKQRALRSLDVERSLRIEQRILDEIGPAP